MSNAPGQITATVNRPFAQAVETYLVSLAMQVGPRTMAPMPDLPPTEMARLAREIAMDIRELPDVLKLFALTPEQYARIRLSPFFIQALAAANVEWNSALNTHERIRLEAACALEDALPSLSARMKNNGEALPGVVEAGKLFAKIAGLGERDQNAGAPGERFTITINLGDGQDLKYEKNVTPIGTGQISIDQQGP